MNVKHPIAHICLISSLVIHLLLGGQVNAQIVPGKATNDSMQTLLQKSNTVDNIICRKYLSEANYELAMNEVLLQQSRAEKENDKFGIMSSNQNLGLIYQAVRRDSEAVSAFNTGLAWAEKNIEDKEFIMTYLSDMIVSTLRINNFAETENLLQKYLNLYNAEDKRLKAEGKEYARIWHLWHIYSFYSELYVREDKLDKAKTALNNATKYILSETDESAKFPYYQAQALYYHATKKYELALQAIENALALDNDLTLLKMQVDIFRALGNNQKAVEVYEKLLKINSEISNEAFNRQMKQLRILNDLNDKNEQERELQYQNEQIADQQQILIISVLFSFVLLFVLYYLIRYFICTMRLKNELEKEKESLIVSEKLLQKAKEEAERANLEKTAFIANISHEVRTPLNAIVGFSELLAENGTYHAFTTEEQLEFATSINRNSEILMNLINDVLDLSRLESSTFRFTLNPCDIVACCKKITEDVKPWLADGVKLTFNVPVESFTTITDLFRFHQLTNKLLMNAAKFTSEGEIDLTINILEKEIHIIVTDTGCGIPIEKQSQVFERFEKLDDFVQGTGLGLPICKLIATKLGGSLSIDSTYTKGSRFIFVHPIIEDSNK